MMKKSNEVSEFWKKKAISFACSFLDSFLESYTEPERAGTSRGDNIGFSSKKMRAAGLLVLHPKLKLHEIASLAEVSPGVLRVWRTDNAFKKEETRLSIEMGVFLAQTFIAGCIEGFLKSYQCASSGAKTRLGTQHEVMEDLGFTILGDEILLLSSKEQSFKDLREKLPGLNTELEKKNIILIDDSPARWTARFASLPEYEVDMETLPILLWFNEFARRAFLKTVKPYIPVPGISAGLLNIRKVEFFGARTDHAICRKWISQPEMRDLFQTMFFSDIEMLADPDSWKKAGKKEIVELKKRADALKRDISYLLDILGD